MDIIIENYLKKIISRAKGTSRSVRLVSRPIGFGVDQILKSDLKGYSGDLSRTGVLAKRGLSRVLITCTSDTSTGSVFCDAKKQRKLYIPNI